MSPDRFEVLMESARHGDEGAWSEIWSELSPAVLGYLRGSGAAEPEDVLAETFLQVARDLPEFHGDWDKFRAWAFTIAHHRLIDATRRSARRPVQLVAEPPEPPGPAARDAAEEALAEISRDRVVEVLGALSPDQRAVLLLRVIGDLSLEQVADTLGKRTGAVKQLQRRGMLAVRKTLSEQGVTK